MGRKWGAGGEGLLKRERTRNPAAHLSPFHPLTSGSLTLLEPLWFSQTDHKWWEGKGKSKHRMILIPQESHKCLSSHSVSNKGLYNVYGWFDHCSVGSGAINLGFKLDLIFSTLLEGIPEDNLEILHFLHVLKGSSPFLTVPWSCYMKNWDPSY